MANVIKHTVKLKNYLNVFNEFVANAAITPGHLVELLSTGKIRSHATAGGNAYKWFALEDVLQGKGIADAYEAEDQVQVWMTVPGEEVYTILANGQNIVKGDLLESAGDGTLTKHANDAWTSQNTGSVVPLSVVGVALENVDMSGSSGVDPNGRIKIMVV